MASRYDYPSPNSNSSGYSNLCNYWDAAQNLLTGRNLAGLSRQVREIQPWRTPMSRLTGLLVLMVLTALTVQFSFPPAVTGQTSKVTFNKDVLPILQKNCQSCHRPGEVAPMSFLTYESTRPWAKAMREAVAAKKMPPWFADPLYGDFRNAPQLTAENIKTIAAWADSGAPEGDAADMPAPINWPEGWRAKPDVIVSIPQPYNVPARGSGEIKTFNVPN